MKGTSLNKEPNAFTWNRCESILLEGGECRDFCIREQGAFILIWTGRGPLWDVTRGLDWESGVSDPAWKRPCLFLA